MIWPTSAAQIHYMIINVHTLIESTQQVTRPLIRWQCDGGWAKRQLSSVRSQRCRMNSRQTSTDRSGASRESIVTTLLTQTYIYHHCNTSQYSIFYYIWAFSRFFWYILVSDVKWVFTGKKRLFSGKKSDSFLTADR